MQAEPGRRAGPAGIHVQAETLAGDARRVAPGTKDIGQVLALDAPLVPAGTAPGSTFPAQLATDLKPLEVELEFAEAHALRGGPGLERPGADQRIALHHPGDAHIHGGDLPRVERRQRVRLVRHRRASLGRLGRREAETGQVEIDGRAFGIGQANPAFQQGTAQVELPATLHRRQLHAQVIDLRTEAAETIDAQIGTGKQLAILPVTGQRLVGLQRRLPGAPVECGETPADPHPRRARQARRIAAQTQLAATIAELPRRRGQRQAGQAAMVQPVAPLRALQGHAPAGAALIRGSLGEGGRQVHRQPLEAGVDAQLAVAAIEDQAQLIGQLATEWQWLRHTKPAAQAIQRHPAVDLDAGPRVATRALRQGTPTHRMPEHLGADIRRAEATGAVEAEGTGELAQLQFRGTDLQLCPLGGEVHLDLWLLPLAQGDIQFQLAAQRSLPLPAGEGLGGADGRFLENLQGIGQAAVQLTLQRQARRLAVGGLGNADRHVADLAVENAGCRHAHIDTIVFDQHFAARLAQARPAGLESQLGTVHQEIQADAASRVVGALGQRALVLEPAILDMSGADRRLQPIGQGRTQAWRAGRQVLLGLQRVAVLETDTQVHVVLLRRVLLQPDQEVARHPALVAHHLQVRALQGETLLVQLPQQARTRLAVAPHLGEQVGDVQAEVFAGSQPFAATEVAAHAAAGVFHRWRAMPGANADALQVGRIAHPRGIAQLRAVVELHVAQGTTWPQCFQGLGSGIRQRCQSQNHRAQRRQVEAVGAERPALHLPLGIELLAQGQLHLAPAGITQTQRQAVHQQIEAVGTPFEIGAQRQIADLHGLAFGVGAAYFRRVQAGRATLHLAGNPLQPELAAGLGAVQVPVAGEAGR